MKDNHLTKSRERSPSKPSPSKPTPFVSSAKFVIGVGFGVLGLIGKAIKGATGLLVNRPANARTTRGLPLDNQPMNNHLVSNTNSSNEL